MTHVAGEGATVRGRKLSFTISPSAEERSQLEHLVRSTTTPAGVATRARAMLLFAEGYPLKEVVIRCDLTPRSLRKWAHRFISDGLAGLRDRPGRGRKPVFSLQR